MGYNIDEAKNLVIKAGKNLIEKGLIARTWGNISARISDGVFVITPSGKAYESLTPDDIVAVNISDCSCEGKIKPSSEKGVHAKVYAIHPEVNFVIHTHQSYASAISLTESREIEIKEESIIGDTVPIASYGLFGSKKLIRGVERAM